VEVVDMISDEHKRVVQVFTKSWMQCTRGK